MISQRQTPKEYLSVAELFLFLFKTSGADLLKFKTRENEQKKKKKKTNKKKKQTNKRITI